MYPELWVNTHQQIHMVWRYLKCLNDRLLFLTALTNDRLKRSATPFTSTLHVSVYNKLFLFSFICS